MGPSGERGSERPLLILGGLAFLCYLTHSGTPALAFAVAWGPNGLFLMASKADAFRLPRVLEPVHPVEPILYRWVGIGWIKRLVANPLWPRLVGIDPPATPSQRQGFLNHAEATARGAEICHGATFLLALAVAVVCLAVGRLSAAGWIMGFNLLLNAYPVMLQRSTRWRVQRLRMKRPGRDQRLG